MEASRLYDLAAALNAERIGLTRLFEESLHAPHARAAAPSNTAPLSGKTATSSP